MNNIAITGNLGKDIEIRHLPDGTPIGNFSVADSQGKDKPAIWWNVSLYGKRSESLAPYLVKGQQVTVFGTVTEREWTDNNGQKRKSMDVRANDIALQGSRQQGQQPAKAVKPAPVNDSFDGLEDCPF